MRIKFTFIHMILAVFVVIAASLSYPAESDSIHFKNFYQTPTVDAPLRTYHEGIVVGKLLLPNRGRNYIVVSAYGHRFFEKSKGPFVIVLLPPDQPVVTQLVSGAKIRVTGKKKSVNQGETPMYDRPVAI